MFSPTTAVVRYQVRDVERAAAFYVDHLGFQVKLKTPVIAIVMRGELHLILSGPGTSGARDMPDGRAQQPGGWNRIHLIVDDIEAEIARLRGAGATFRNDAITGPGGKQILLQDPSGNFIELFQPAARAAT